MIEANWISKYDICQIHSMVLNKDGDSEGIHDENLLEIALNKPKKHFAYGNQNIFLLDDGYQLQQSDDLRYVEIMIDLAQGKISQLLNSTSVVKQQNIKQTYGYIARYSSFLLIILIIHLAL